ncbi:DUF4962 domain-containing protein [bacterium]|nr:DUF4962 domain-containing protein [bacterium]
MEHVSAVLIRLVLAASFLALLVCSGCKPGPAGGDGPRLAQGEFKYLGPAPDFDPELLRPAPADGDTVLNDPPGFNWQPEDSARAFVFEVSRDPEFLESDGLLEKARGQGPLVPASPGADPLPAQGGRSWLVAGLPLPLYHPSFGLGPGQWFWRWRCVLPDGSLTPPAAVRRFTVAAEAIEYTVPKISELLARIPAGHPRLLVRAGQLDSIKSLIVSSEPHRRLWERIQRFTDDSLLTRPLMQEPPRFPEGPFNYALWRDYYDQARKMGQTLDFLGFCYLVTGEARYADRAREWLLHLTAWDPDGSSNMEYNDEVAMPILLNGARAWDWIYGSLAPAERDSIRAMLALRADQAYQRWQKRPYHLKPFASHETRLVNYISQAGIVLHGESPEADKWLAYVLPMVTTFYPPWGGRDGGYSEGPSYWMMYFNYMLQSADAIRCATGLDILKKPFYRNNGWFKLYGYPYFGAMLPFGDTGIGSYWPADKLNLYHLATLFDNPYFRWRAEMSRPGELPVNETEVPSGIFSFLWLDEGPGHVAALPPADLPRCWVFRDIGLVAFHQDPADPQEIYFLLKSSPHGAWSHTYADQNSFYIQGFGEALAIQSGYYPHYGHPHHKAWTWQTRAHNSVLVDGEGQTTGRDRAANGKIIEWSFGSGAEGSLDYAAADATPSYAGRLDKFVRRVFYRRPDEFLILDDLQAPKDVRFDWLLHALEKMEIDERARTVTVKKGRARLTVEFLEPQGLTFSQTDQFSESPGPGYPNQWHLTVSTKDKRRAAAFVVRMIVWQAK